MDIQKRVNSIQNLAEHMLSLPQMEAPVKHHFSKGVYAREIFMPKGMVIVGKIHKTRHLNIVSQGKCTVITTARRLEVEAPFTFESVEGEQKVVIMHEDTVWTTIHLTNETDLAKIEQECIAETYDKQLVDSLLESCEDLLCLGE